MTEEKEIVFDKDSEISFAILATDLTFFKGIKDKILANKKVDDDPYDFLYHVVCSTEYPSPVLVSKKILREMLEKFPGMIDNIGFWLLVKDSVTKDSPYGDHIEISRKDFDEIMKEPDAPAQEVMTKQQMEDLAKELTKQFSKEAAKNGLSKKDVDDLVQKAMAEQVKEISKELSKQVAELEKRQAESKKKEEEEKASKTKSAMAEQMKEAIAEKARAEMEKKLSSVAKTEEKKGEKMTDRTSKEMLKDAAKFTGNNLLHGAKQAAAGESMKLLIDALKKAFENEPVILGALENELIANLIIIGLVSGARTLASETNMFPENMKEMVDEYCGLVLQNAGKEVTTPLIANLRPFLLTIGRQSKSIMNMQETASPFAFSQEELGVEVDVEEDVTETKSEKKVRRVGE